MEKIAPDKPLDHPYPQRPHRWYVTLTNHCNRACPWCSTCSSPAGNSWLELKKLYQQIPPDRPMELQLEGGEPTLHSDFWGFVRFARQHPLCSQLILCTNGVAVPHKPAALAAWLNRLGQPLTLKLSINHYLLERDAALLELAQNLLQLMNDHQQLLILNVRLRRGIASDDQAVVEAVEQAGLMPHANVFYLQRYGFASDQAEWETPWLAGENFTLINPDGSCYATDLIQRSEAMRALP